MTTYAGPERPRVPHYRQGSIEPIDFVRAQGLSFCEGNIVKYVVRWRHKGGVEDLLKARDYLNWLIEDAQGVGVATPAEMKERLLAGARGERRPEPGEPKTWVSPEMCDVPAEPPRLVPRMVPDGPAYTGGAEGGTFISVPNLPLEGSSIAPISGEDALPATVRERLRQDMNERY